jgi:hypothetical protein
VCWPPGEESSMVLGFWGKCFEILIVKKQKRDSIACRVN